MSFVIGSSSKNTVLDILKVGLNETVKRFGVPEELQYQTDGCEMVIRGADVTKRVDGLTLIFAVHPEKDAQAVTDELDKAGIPNKVEFKNGACCLNLPSFEWRQLNQLAPVDTVVERMGRETLRCKSWKVKVNKFVQTNISINKLIEQMKEMNASDLHLRAGSAPYVRVDGDLNPLDYPLLTSDDMERIVIQLGGENEAANLEAERETSFQYHSAGVAYLRVSGYYKMGAMALAIRFIPESPPDFESLELPPEIRDVADAHRGLFLVCGITGSGKTTTLASLVDYINRTRHANIITIEDPIEYVFEDKKSIVSQRQVGRDTHSTSNALKGALREDPDVILVGEMRDMDTVRAALSAAETGHLVFSTLHTMTAVDTVNRIISFFPPSERDLIRQELAFSLRGVACQRLLRKKGGGRIPCIELLLGGMPIVREAILEGNISKLHGVIELESSMTTFDEYAVMLYQEGKVTKEEAISACSDLESFERIISGIKGFQGKLLK